jgi:DNA-binding winged helix-turn-helix (wHTH) protein
MQTHSGGIRLYENPAPLRAGQTIQASADRFVASNLRGKKFPLDQLLVLLSAQERFRFELSLRIRMGNDTVQIELPGVSQRGELPRMSVEDLVAKINESVLLTFVETSLIQRHAKRPDNTISEIARFGEVCVDFRKMELRRSGARVKMTASEFKTLRYFVCRPAVVISRDELLNEVWGYQNYPTTRTVDNRIFNLRKKLERTPSRPVHFLSVFGVGYKFMP